MKAPATWGAKLGAWGAIALLWSVHVLPLGVQAWLGRGLGALLWQVGRPRRRVALRNLALCFPTWTPAQRVAVAREHFAWLGRSILERGLLWFAPVPRLQRLIHVEGDVGLAARSERPVMWLVPHFLALDVAGSAAQIFQDKRFGSIYQAQSNPVFDAAVKQGRLRFDKVELFARNEGARGLMRAIRQGKPFFNLPDMDFGARDAAFVPFFGVPAATLLAPSRMARALNMVVQPVIAHILPGGQGYRVQFMEPWADFPTDDPEADTRRMNAWIEAQILLNPSQYLWVHKRFKTRPQGEAGLY
ncbi:MAG: lipid A biosynthesis acyltransferase [Leptothrix ochracea]|uniref:LpxL/LpxP family acyltransferase n=1 Tax=Leptothrix ochracea TaxID=735331 RepID=UPI0034E1A838